MQPGPGSGHPRVVAVGPSRVVSAHAFGTIFDHTHVTSYADFHVEVDVASVRRVGLVGGPETMDLLLELVDALGMTPGLRPATLSHADDSVLVVLEPSTEVYEARAAQILTDLHGLRAQPAHPPRQRLLTRLLGRRNAQT